MKNGNMGKQCLIRVFVLTLLTLSFIGVYVVKAQSQHEQLTVSISPSGNIEALAVYFTAIVNGGTFPFNFRWHVNNTIIEGATASHYTFSPASTGTYLIYAAVTDSLNSSATSNIVTVTTKSYLQIDLANHNYFTTATVGQPVYFSALALNGTPPFRHQWYYRQYAQFQLAPIGSTLEGDKSQNFTFIANSTGHYLITVRVWDSQNIEGYFMSLPPGIWVNVNEPPTSPTPNPTKTPTATPTTLPTPIPSLTPTLSPNISTTITPTQTPILSPSPTIPEYPRWTILLFPLIIALLAIVVTEKKKKRKKSQEINSFT